MAKALELVVKERKNGTGKNSWRELIASAESSSY